MVPVSQIEIGSDRHASCAWARYTATLACRLALTLVWICLLAILAQTVSAQSADFEPATRQIKVISTNLSGFGVPFSVDENNQQFVEVHLYFSKDNGKTWQFHDRLPTSKHEFPFHADGDGEYCFALRTLDVNKRLLPEGDIKYPELKIIVDTKTPELDFRIDSDPAGRVGCRWKAVDDNLNTKTFKIQYRANSANGPSAWKQVPIDLNGSTRNGIYADQIAWWPDTATDSLEVQIQIADYAGNVASVDRRVTVADTTWRHKSKSSTLDSEYNQRPPTDSGNGYSGQRSSSAKPPSSNKPPNVVCENGVCRIVPQQNDATAVAANKAQDQWQRSIVPIETAKDRAAPPQVPAQKTRWTINQDPDAATPSRQLDRFGTIKSTPPNGFNQQQGPPRPDDWTEADESYARQAELALQKQQLAAQPRNNSPAVYGRPAYDSAPPPPSSPNSSGSIGWESEVQHHSPPQVEATGTTLHPSAAILPPTPSSTRREPREPRDPGDPGALARLTEELASNPSTMKREGDMVIAQSTTTWPSNQFSGPPASQIVALPPQLAPDTNTFQEQRRQSIPTNQNYANTGYEAILSRPMHPKRQTSPPDSTRPTQRIPTQQSGFRRNAPDNNNANTNPTSASVIEGNGLEGLSKSNTQIISSKRFQLNYDIDAIDPSGVGQIDLWITRDRGQSWHVWGQDPDNTSPFPVEVQEEGLFGFRIVVRSRDGLTGRGPMSGDSPDMWILVDTQSPMTKIMSVPYGRKSEAGKLVINYRASDPHLSLRPIRLYWSPNPTSQWTVVEEGLRNEGRYVWKVPRNVPDRIFLRLEAFDQAGNVGVHNLSQAIDVSGLVPRGTIYGVVPVGD